MDILRMTAKITAAYAANHSIANGSLPDVVREVATVMSDLRNGNGHVHDDAGVQPAVPLERSLTNDSVFCLECGKRYRTLKRHLRTSHQMAPEEYRRKWGLSIDYPLVAPGYARIRADVARNIGLGQLGADHRRRTARARQGVA